MLSLLLTMSFFAGATDVWTAQPDVRVMPDSRPVGRPMAEARLYAAGGEYESFQICIEGSRKGWEAVELSGGASLDGAIPAPAIWRVGYVQTVDKSGAPVTVPDPLRPLHAFDVPAHETRALWVTYHVPRGTPPGLYRGVITLRPGNAPRRDVPVTIEVFGFDLPRTPPIAVWADLDRRALDKAYGLLTSSLNTWQPMYERFIDFPFAFGPWRSGALVSIGGGGRADTAELKSHLAWLVENGHWPVIDMGLGAHGVAPFPEPPNPTAQDSLQLYFYDMAAWLQGRGWLDRAVFQVMPLPEGKDWREARAAYFRARRADDRIALAIEGPLHPYFERYADVWIVPFEHYQPNAHAQLREGGSLAVDVAYEAASVTATSSGAPAPDAVSTRPADAYDGSLFTAWWSGDTPSPRNAEKLTIHFVEPVSTESFRVGWRPGHEPAEIIVRTAFDGRLFNRASVDWEDHQGAHAYDQSWAEGTFKTEKRFLALELEFRGSREQVPVAVTEIEFGPPGTQPADRPGDVAVWLRPPDTGFPSLAAGASAVEARIMPWICWAHGSGGIRLGELNAWPEAWTKPGILESDIWASEDRITALFYPAPEGPAPSIRAHLLRDGVEDYAYLQACSQRIKGLGVEAPEPVENALRHRLYSSTMRPSAVATYGDKLPEWRRAMGRFLTGLPVEEEEEP